MQPFLLASAVILGSVLGPECLNAEANTKHSSVGRSTSDASEPWLRTDQPVNRLQVSAKDRHLAFTGADDQGLFVLDTETKHIYQVTDRQVGSSFFWAPHGHRLLYREQTLLKDQKSIESRIRAFDAAIGRSHEVERLDGPTGILTFDPRDQRVHWLYDGRIQTKKLVFPDNRLAAWQLAQRTEQGKWLIAQNGVVWASQGGTTMRKVGGSGQIEGFSISPDGSTLAWATAAGELFMSEKGGNPKFVGYGKDPTWHPKHPILLAACGRTVGNTIIGYDLCVYDSTNQRRFLTATQHSDERWPNWSAKSSVVYYTKARTTDIYRIEVKLR
jgi:hypothetical protein